MPQRPREHQLEDISRKEFSNILPETWVDRDKDKDYGIDVEVEIFDEDYRDTGLVFWVQLKATESEDINKQCKVDIDVETLQYYQKLDLPVLIARYSHKNKKFYIAWAHEVDLNHLKENQKQKKIKFEKTLDSSSISNFVSLIKKFKKVRNKNITLPININLNFSNAINGEIDKWLFEAELKKELAKQYEFISFSNGDSSIVEFTKEEQNFIVSLAGAPSVKFFIGDKSIQTDYPKISEILLSGIAISLADSGNIELASKFFLYTDASKYLFRNKDILIKILPCLLLSSFFDEVIDLVINHTNDREDNLLDLPVLMSSMLLRHNTPKFEKSVESFLLKSLEKYKQKKWRDLYGQTHYNLANHYRSRSMYKAALHNFIEAKKNDSSYLKRDYFYREVAGTLFELGRYKLSSVCYEKAIELGNRNEDNALYADALMHQGQYDEAIKYFSKYLKGTESPTPYWILKYIFLDSFTENSKPLSQRRKPKQASRHVNISLPDLDLEQNLEEALKLDSLCALAWFNLGIYGRDKENYESASYCFMASSILCPQDIESWVNCTLSAFKTGNLSLVPHVIHSAYYFNKEHYLSALYQSLKDIPNNLKESLYMIIESLIKDFGEGHDERELRFISPDNKSAKTMRIKIPQN